MKTKTAVLQDVVKEYHTASAQGKTEILDRLEKTVDMHRKSIVRRLRVLQMRVPGVNWNDKRGRKMVYGADVTAALYSVWEVGSYCCAELLKPEIAVYIEALQKLGVWKHSSDATTQLLSMSVSSLKRRISTLRSKHHIKGRATTTPSPIKQRVKVYAGPWRSRGIGHRQFDTVVHCGDRLIGDMAYTVNGVDPAVLWSNRRAQLNKGEVVTLENVEYIEYVMPTRAKSRHADSGSEFLNWYFLDKSERSRIDMTRCRSGKKNDNAFVEERNNNIVRKWIQYERYDTPEQVDALNAIYEVLDLYLNHFQAVRRCIRRERVGSRYVRVYDEAQTPYARVCTHAEVSEVDKEKLRTLHATLNPVLLRREILKRKKTLAELTKRQRRM